MPELISALLHPTASIQSAGTIGGYILLTAIIFAECGLLVGFFLPGDSLLFAAGVLAAQGLFNVWVVMVLLLAAAIVGVSVGYAVGARWGRRLFLRDDSRFFKKENLQKAEAFYDRHGGKTIILARFIPIIRTFVPVVAGIGRMSYAKLVLYNVIGGVVWVVGLVGAGYWLGEKVANIDKYLLPIIAIIIFLSILPGFIAMLRTPERRRSAWGMIRGMFSRNPRTEARRKE
ncbi:MAG: VTT domain-containing protein [Patescibacteria group bacterium]|mgnify:CR=1 FL=1